MQTAHHILYDGNCKFCTAAANFALAHNSNATLVITAVQAPAARVLLRERGIQFVNLNTIYVVTPTTVLVKSKAIFAICTQLTTPYKWGRIFSLLPTWLTDGVYDFIAKNRYRLN